MSWSNLITSCNKCEICKNYIICSNYFSCNVTNRGYKSRDLHCNCNKAIHLITCKSCLEQYVGSATNVLEYIRAISIPTTKIDMGGQNILTACVKIITIFFSYCLLKLLNKFIVMSQTWKKFYGTGKNIGKASYLCWLTAWTVWMTSTVPNVRAKGNKFLQQIVFS